MTEYTSLRWEGSLKLDGELLQCLFGFARARRSLHSIEEALRPHDFLVERFCVNASQEEGVWLEAADGKRHPIQGSCSLGRTAANTIVLESSKVSRQHALIHLQNIGEPWLIDFGSSNGTFLNKRRIHQPVRLSDGDQITIGDEVFKFRQPLAISDEHKTAVTQRTLREIENIPCWLLVADIRGFTPLSRSMQGEDLDVLLGAWILTCKEIIENQHGFINKYLGDGFLAYWPRRRDDSGRDRSGDLRAQRIPAERRA